jgi:uncharacterized protein YacL
MAPANCRALHGRAGEGTRPYVSIFANIISCSIRQVVLSLLSTLFDQTMKLGGFLLLLSGWGIVVAALIMLHTSALTVFVLAGVAVEILGLVFVARAHLPMSEDNG